MDWTQPAAALFSTPIPLRCASNSESLRTSGATRGWSRNISWHLARWPNAGDADSAIGTAASGVVSALGKLSPGLATQKFGAQSVGDFVTQAAPLAVAALRSRALENELRKNGQAIERELMISEGLMAFLAEKIAADDAAIRGPGKPTRSSVPSLARALLPKDWAVQRTAFLKHAVDMSAINSAQDAARKLRTAFIAASEGHSRQASCSSWYRT